MALINNLGIVYHQYCSSSYLVLIRADNYWPDTIPLTAMKIKFELDTDKAARATVAIAASYGLGQVSKGTKYPLLAFANAFALIIIIAILYSTHPPILWPRKYSPHLRVIYLLLSSQHDT
jgi:hypothetical protein